MRADGIILKGIGGFYYVKTADAVIECRLKGIFRKQGLTPVAGDSVLVEGDETGHVITSVSPRKNVFQRPPIANVGRAFIVVSAVDPAPNLLVLDKLIAIFCKSLIKPSLLFTKTDIKDADECIGIYEAAGFDAIDIKKDPAATEKLEALAKNELSVFVGNSGVGKSTLLNQLLPELGLETGETSKKLGRGRHTTRAVELYPWLGGYAADTPGFSAVDFERAAQLSLSELSESFLDFSPYDKECYFASCSHTVEKGCGVLKALAGGKLQKSRHDSYCAIYAELKEKKKWN